jgi:release factor glutamine methyltransferase
MTGRSNPLSTPYESSLKPSVYSCMLLSEALKHLSVSACSNLLDIGVGSGVMLAAAAQLGVKDLWGVDINAEAIKAAASLLSATAPTHRPQLLHGDMWAPLPDGMRFSLVVANLPHFPGEYHDVTRPVGWDGGGGRKTIDRFMAGLPERLANDGVALMTHQDLIGFDTTCALIRRLGLRCATLTEWLVFEPPERMQTVRGETLQSVSTDIKHIGGYAFMNARVIKIFK